MHILRTDARHLPLADASVDAIVTDPPYELGFMGRDWDDSGVAFDPATWAEALRVAKPGAHLLAFGAPRTYPELAVAIRQAGWERRDTLMWLYGSGFPKSLDVSKAIDRAAGAEREVVGQRHVTNANQGAREGLGYAERGGQIKAGLIDVTTPATDEARRWEGWGTALKPAYEPIVLARKPLVGTVAANVLAHGTGGLNIDGTRIGMSEQDRDVINSATWHAENLDRGAYGSFERDGQTQQLKAHDGGRWPANLLLDEEAAALLDASTGLTGAFAPVRGDEPSRAGIGEVYGERERVPGSFYGDQGGPSRFFYTAKASREEREAGLLGHLPCIRCGGLDTTEHETERGVAPCRRNPHPTVKPVDLMRWLLTLVTPPGGTVLDPFLGSGTTGVAAGTLGFPFIGADLDEHYLMIARLRMAAERPMMLAL